MDLCLDNDLHHYKKNMDLCIHQVLVVLTAGQQEVSTDQKVTILKVINEGTALLWHYQCSTIKYLEYRAYCIVSYGDV